MLLPCCVAAAVLRLPRQFFAYVYVDSKSIFARYRSLLPVGIVQPSQVRKASSALVCGYTKPSALFALLPFASPILLALVTLIGQAKDGLMCNASLWVSCILHVGIGISFVALRVQRSLTIQVFGAAGLWLTALGHVFVALDFSSDMTSLLLMVQSAMALLRCIMSIFMVLVENRMISLAQSDREENKTMALSPAPLWSVGCRDEDQAQVVEEQPCDTSDNQTPGGDPSVSAEAVERRERELGLLRAHDSKMNENSVRRVAACREKIRRILVSHQLKAMARDTTTLPMHRGVGGHVCAETCACLQRRLDTLRSVVELVGHERILQRQAQNREPRTVHPGDI